MPQSQFIPSSRKIIESRMFAAAITVLLIFAWSYAAIALVVLLCGGDKHLKLPDDVWYAH